jgi:hypothetical protein
LAALGARLPVAQALTYFVTWSSMGPRRPGPRALSCDGPLRTAPGACEAHALPCTGTLGCGTRTRPLHRARTPTPHAQGVAARLRTPGRAQEVEQAHPPPPQHPLDYRRLGRAWRGMSHSRLPSHPRWAESCQQRWRKGCCWGWCWRWPLQQSPRAAACHFLRHGVAPSAGCRYQLEQRGGLRCRLLGGPQPIHGRLAWWLWARPRGLGSASGTGLRVGAHPLPRAPPLPPLSTAPHHHITTAPKQHITETAQRAVKGPRTPASPTSVQRTTEL